MNTFALVTFIIIILLHQQILSQVEDKNNLCAEKISLDRDTSLAIINEQIKESLKSKLSNDSPPKIILKRKEIGKQISLLKIISKKSKR